MINIFPMSAAGSRDGTGDSHVRGGKCHELKNQYYDLDEIRAWVADKADIQPDCASFSVVMFN